MFSWLKFWRRRPLTSMRVRMYSRQGCHLCEEAWRTLQTAQDQWGFHLEKVDVDDNPDWQKNYGDCVPVVTVNDKVRFRGAVNPVLLHRLLRSESR